MSSSEGAAMSNISSVRLNGSLNGTSNSGVLPVYRTAGGSGSWVIDFSGTFSTTALAPPADLSNLLSGAITWNILTDVDRNGAFEIGPVVTSSGLVAPVSFSNTTTGAGINFTFEEKLSDIRSSLLNAAA